MRILFWRLTRRLNTFLFLTFIVIALLALTNSLFAQQQDSTSIAATDSLAQPAADSLQTLTPPPGSPIEGKIKYWADEISFSINEKVTQLKGNARIEYQSVKLEAAKIDIDWTKNAIYAEGIADTTDSLGNPIYRGRPILTEGGTEPIEGSRLEYDFKNNRGKVLEGKTKMEPGFYNGEDIRKVGEETLFIQDAYFTTCDLDHPHFYFRSSKMRLRLNKEANAKPVILYIADVPILGIPFATFSLRRGRRSGIIIPTFGQNSFGGRYLENFGYYWAPSDYWDATFLATFYEKTGMLFNGRFNYKKRYTYNGNVSGSYSPKDVTTGEKRQRWQVNFNHSQKFGQTMTLTGSGSFVSDKDFRSDYYSDFNQRTNQTLEATATFKKTFSGSRIFTANIRRLENLQTEKLDFDFPNIAYSQPSRSLIPYRGGSIGGAAWYNNIKYSFSTNIRSAGSRTAIAFDSTSGEAISFNRSQRSGWQHNITPTYSTKILKYFSLTPSMSFNELWAAEYVDYEFIDSLNTVVPRDTVQELSTRHLLTNIGLNMRTTMYGLWEMPVSPLKVVRHKMDPVVGFRFQPDYSDPTFGYYQSFTDTTGKEIRRDRFAGNVFGRSTPSGKVAGMTFGLNNLFQGKVVNDEEEKKVDLFRVDFNTGYNFASDSLRMADLSTSFQSKPVRNLNMTLNARHSFYKLAPDGRTRINQFQAPDLASWSFSLNYSLSLRPPSADKKEEISPFDTLSTDPIDDVFNPIQREDIPGYQTFEDFEGLDIPWNIDMRFSYRYSDFGSSISKSFNTSINARLQLTKNWNISYNNRINILEKELVDQRFNISRNLHCWIMNFTWSPNPNFSFYRVEIRIKESILRDLKLTKSASGAPF